MIKELKVTKTVELHADISKVWEALTNPELSKKYMFNCAVMSDWKVGSPIVYKEFKEGKAIEHVKGKIVNIEPGKLLQFTAWGPESGLEDVESNYTIVTCKLSSKNGHTELSVTQENFGGDEKRYNDSNQGWDYALTGLKKLFRKLKLHTTASNNDAPFMIKKNYSGRSMRCLTNVKRNFNLQERIT